MSQDFLFIVGWWAVLFLIGSAALPLARKIFASWWDQGYVLSKAVGLAGVTFISWYMGSFKIIPFTQLTIFISLGILFGIGIISQNLEKTSIVLTKLLNLIGIESPFRSTPVNTIKKPMISWKLMLVLELFFFCSLWFWSYIKAFEPDIRGLEKFMDYGFAQTIYNSSYFPPPDMWYAGGTINYYYFGHTMMAVLSKLSSIDLAYGYNLTLAMLFALCFTMSFGIGCQLLLMSSRQREVVVKKRWYVLVGFLAAWLVTLSGNMQTIYAFTKGYNGEDTPPPFWSNSWPANEFLAKIPEGMNKYWYANATRFIPFTIHEFPSYSFVVSDNHGHVLSIPFTLLAISSLLTLFGRKGEKRQASSVKRQETLELLPFGLYGLLGGILLMTNALDGPIYMGLFTLLLATSYSLHAIFSWNWFREKGIVLMSAVVGLIVATFPFLLNFTSFANGLAVNCPPKFLENTKFGPIIFETVDKCQKSPLWMMTLLWGFFWFGGITLIVFGIKRHVSKKQFRFEFTPLHKFLITAFLYTVAMIVFCEFFYFKDIYPAHFRSNTMFKLGYQTFMFSSLMCAYVIVEMIIKGFKDKQSWSQRVKWGRRVFFILLIPQLFLVSIFPYFSVRSYFGNLQVYKGLYGLTWFERDFPDDFKAMKWLASQVASSKQQVANDKNGEKFLTKLVKTDTHVHDNFFTSHLNSVPGILEADGDSYTDYQRFSSFAGMPTIVGWGVHEWLWRGSYDVVSPRKDEVKVVYEGLDQAKRIEILNKYNIRYLIVGQLERQKFVALNEQSLKLLGKEVYRSGNTVIYDRGY